MALDRRSPLGIVEDPATVDLGLDLLARLVLQVGLELRERHLAVLVGVEAVEHLQVNRHFGAVTLLQPDRTERPLHLANVEDAVAVRVELLEDLGHVDLGVALLRRSPLGRVKDPVSIELLLDLCARPVLQVGLKLRERHLAVLVGVEAVKHLLINHDLLAVALLQANRTERPLHLANIEDAVVVRVELLEDLGHVNLGVALLRRLPLGRVEGPASDELLLDRRARLRVNVRLKLLERHLAVLVGIEGIKCLLVELEFDASALLEANRTERPFELANIEEAVAARIELLEDRPQGLLGPSILHRSGVARRLHHAVLGQIGASSALRSGCTAALRAR
eukprot:scaffold126068_cov60-Phaeocystis_antarctica.AAC.2